MRRYSPAVAIVASLLLSVCGLTACGGASGSTANNPSSGAGRSAASSSPGTATAASGTPTGKAPHTDSSATVSASASASEPASAAAPTQAGSEAASRAFAAMTDQQRVGQLFMVSLESGQRIGAEDSMIASRFVGGVVLLGNGWSSAETVKAATSHLSGLPTAAGVGLYLAADQEGGSVQRLHGPGFDPIPAATVQGSWPPDELRAKAETWGRQMGAVGINLDLAPVADTVPESLGTANAPIGALHREFSSDPSVNGAHAAAFIDGLTAAGIGSSVKHFPGLGRVQGNTDYTASGTTDSQTAAGDPYLAAFAQAMTANPEMVMVSVATYSRIDPGVPAAFSPAVIDDLLRGQLDWKGVVISDSMAAAAVRQVPASERAVRFIAAGGDIAIIPGDGDTAAAIDGVLARMASDPAFKQTVDTAVMRVLEAKSRAGLLH